jgi:hypothetical protein
MGIDTRTADVRTIPGSVTASWAVVVQHEPCSGLRVDTARYSADVDQLTHECPLETADEETGEAANEQPLRESGLLLVWSVESDQCVFSCRPAEGEVAPCDRIRNHF